MSASFGIAMIGVAAVLAIPLTAFVMKGKCGDLSGLAAIALLSALASCVASH